MDSQHPSEHGTIVGPSLWPALLAGARLIVAEHDGGKLCDHCNRGRCGRLTTAQGYLTNEEMLKVEADANKAWP